MFKLAQSSSSKTVNISIEGHSAEVPDDFTVAAALLTSGFGPTRTTPVSGAARAPFCMMGVCYECLVVIDGQPNRRACQERVRDGMRIERQNGAGPAP